MQFFCSRYLVSLTRVCQGCTSAIEKYEQEVQDLRGQLELAKERINELEVSI